MNVSVIGLGRLGLPFSFFLASNCWRSFNFKKKPLELIEFGKYYN